MLPSWKRLYIDGLQKNVRGCVRCSLSLQLQLRQLLRY